MLLLGFHVWQLISRIYIVSQCQDDQKWFATRSLYLHFIWGFCNMNMMQEAREVLSEMIGNGITPDKTAYNCLVSKYQKLGDMEEASSLQTEMESVLISCKEDDTVSGGET